MKFVSALSPLTLQTINIQSYHRAVLQTQHDRTPTNTKLPSHQPLTMETFSYISLTLALLLIIKLLFSSKNKKNLPPSPLSLPIIGHLYLFKKPLHHTLARLADRYGPVLFLRFGSRPVLVVSSATTAQECFTTNDASFANRPHLPSGEHLTMNHQTIGSANYGPHWRNIRRIATVDVLSTHQLLSSAQVLAGEVREMVRRLFRESTDGFVKVELKSAMFELALNVITRMIAGKRYYGEEAGVSEEATRFREITEEALALDGVTNLGDFLPLLRWVDFQGVTRRSISLQNRREKFLQRLIDEHQRENNEIREEEKKRTMIGDLLSLQRTDPKYYDDRMIKALCQSLLNAGTDPSSNTIVWAMSHLLNNPESLKKAQAEIDVRVGNGRLLDESDLSNLPYLQCIIKETLRLTPVGPLLVPHESANECIVGGFHVPCGTLLLVNIYHIHRDPRIWEEPTKFKPERFEDGKEEGKLMMPFGMGRRKCPGEGFAMREVGLMIGTLIQCFEWERVGEEEVDMTEGSGLVLARTVPLEVLYRPRQAMVGVLSGL